MTQEEKIPLYCNGSWKTGVESVLEYWEKYLPKHKFMMEQIDLGYELKKKAG